MIIDDRLARRVLAALDLTSLGEDDDHVTIERLCARADTAWGHPAAVCVYPEWIDHARAELDALDLGAVRIATVVNFPDGSALVERIERETRRAVAAGADEIDMVLPWQALRSGDTATARRAVEVCRRACGDRLLKVIIESGELETTELIRAASLLALQGGADFLKTSTGKCARGATLAAAEIMLGVIAERGGDHGFKAAGGIRSLAEAAGYVALAERQFGRHWTIPQHFRIGASSLLNDIVRQLAGPAPGL
jgi:deoxyribose-phosphate aldolase